jgi:hypothetical protein
VPSSEIAARPAFPLNAAVKRVEVSSVLAPSMRPTTLLTVAVDVAQRQSVHVALVAFVPGTAENANANEE